MAVTIEEVQKIAKLARLEMSAADAEKLAPELNRILGFVEQLEEVDTSQVEPTTAVIANKLRLRADEIDADPLTGGNRRADVLANAPVSEEGFFGVPKVIE